MFQCSSASRKFLNVGAALVNDIVRHRFSALQRAENSSIVQSHQRQIETLRFSALQRAENSSICVPTSQPAARPFRFSALQRAENSSMRLRALICHLIDEFQCSSASRKFLNPHILLPRRLQRVERGCGFRLLQRMRQAISDRRVGGCQGAYVIPRPTVQYRENLRLIFDSKRRVIARKRSPCAHSACACSSPACHWSPTRCIVANMWSA